MSKKINFPSCDCDSCQQSQETPRQFPFLQASGSDLRMLEKGDSSASHSPHSADFVPLPSISHTLQRLNKINDNSQQSVIRQQMHTALDRPLRNEQFLTMEQPRISTETPTVKQNLFQPSADPVWIKNTDPFQRPHVQRQNPHEDPNDIQNNSSSSNPNYDPEDRFLSASRTLQRISQQANQQLYSLSSTDECLHHHLSIPFHQPQLNVNKSKLAATSPKSRSLPFPSARHHPHPASSSHSDQDVPGASKPLPLGQRESSEDVQYTQHGAIDTTSSDQGSSQSSGTLGKKVRN